MGYPYMHSSGTRNKQASAPAPCGCEQTRQTTVVSSSRVHMPRPLPRCLAHSSIVSSVPWTTEAKQAGGTSRLEPGWLQLAQLCPACRDGSTAVATPSGRPARSWRMNLASTNAGGGVTGMTTVQYAAYGRVLDPARHHGRGTFHRPRLVRAPPPCSLLAASSAKPVVGRELTSHTLECEQGIRTCTHRCVDPARKHSARKITATRKQAVDQTGAREHRSARPGSCGQASERTSGPRRASAVCGRSPTGFCCFWLGLSSILVLATSRCGPSVMAQTRSRHLARWQRPAGWSCLSEPSDASRHKGGLIACLQRPDGATPGRRETPPWRPPRRLRRTASAFTT